MLKRFAAPLLGAAVIAAAFAGSVAAQDKPTMGVVVKIGGIPWFNAMEVGITAEGEALGVDAVMIGPTSADPALQVRAIEDLIAKGVDIIGVVPNDANAIEPVLEKARAAGIKVVTHESPGAEERRLELRDGLGQGLRRSPCRDARPGDGRQGRVRRLCRLADRAASQRLGRLRHRLSQGEVSRHDGGR